MPRLKKAFPTATLHLQMPEKVRKQLDNLQTQTQADSLAEVLRRALAVYGFLWEETAKGGRVVIQGRGEDREVVLL